MRVAVEIWVRAASVVAIAIASIACGGADEPESRASGAPMVPTTGAEPVALVSTIPQGEAPRIAGIRFEPSEPFRGQTVRATPEVLANDDQKLTLDFTWSVGGQRLASSGPSVTLYRANKGDAIEVTLVANHRGNKSAPYTATTRVGNRPPVISRVRFDPSSKIEVGQAISALPAAKDPDADPLTFDYRWSVNGRAVSERSATLETAGLQRGDSIQLEVVARDGDDASEPFRSQEIKLANSAPRIVSQPGGPGADGVFRYRVVAEDPDGDPVARYSLAQAPQGMTIVASFGQIEWLPTHDQEGTHTVEVVVEDQQGARSAQRFELAVGISPGEGGAKTPPAAAAN